jgi:hypothetical protein
MKTKTFIFVAAALMFPLTAFDQRDLFEDFTPYPYTSGGPDPGAFLITDNNLVLMDRPLVLSQMRLTGPLKLDTKAIPKNQLNTADLFDFQLQVILASKNIDAQTASQMSEVSGGSIDVKEGQIVSLPGKMAFRHLINEMPRRALVDLHDEVRHNRNVVFITDVKRFTQATAIFEWKKDVSSDNRLRLLRALSARASVKWLSARRVQVRYTEPINVAYKGYQLTRADLKLIRAEIKERDQQGDFKVSATGLRAVIDQLFFQDVADDDEDLDFGYEVEFLDAAHRSIASLANSKKDVYVEEKGKVGRKNGVNVFFRNNALTANDAVHNVRLTVWVRSRDQDGSTEWRRESSKSIIYTYSDITQGTLVFNPWDKVIVQVSLKEVFGDA